MAAALAIAQSSVKNTQSSGCGHSSAVGHTLQAPTLNSRSCAIDKSRCRNSSQAMGVLVHLKGQL